MLPLARPALWLAGAWAIALGIALGSLVPGGLVAAASRFDKLEHALAYLLLALWWMGLLERRRHLGVALGALALGAVLEAAQAALTTTRSADWGDVAANAAGVAAALALARAGAGTWIQRVERALGWR